SPPHGTGFKGLASEVPRTDGESAAPPRCPVVDSRSRLPAGRRRTAGCDERRDQDLTRRPLRRTVTLRSHRPGFPSAPVPGSFRMTSDYAKQLGARLRAIRQQQGLSLQGVEEKSGGRWKAVVVGSYERGDRAVTVNRLAELAAFYRVPVSELLPEGAPIQFEYAGKVVLDLAKLYD